RRFGFGSRSLPRNLSLALGSGAVTPLELASAYAVFANGGFRVAVHFIERIEDLSGRILYLAEPPTACPECEPASEPVGMPETVSAAAKPDNRPRNVAPRVISAQNAYLMTSMMRDVIQRGTGRAARRLGRQDLAGKTGTTNDQHDAWFCGYNRELVAAGWVGFDQLQSLGDGETGGYTALPMWIDFMRAAVADIPDRPPVQPPGLVTVRVDPETGLQAGAATPDAIFETFLVGSVPLQAVVSPAPEAKGKTPKERGPVVPEQLF
ncbi:MAG: penicillin-binding transpeptidase domain-containing protein, partial [Gammaproteobacteria bacterium]